MSKTLILLAGGGLAMMAASLYLWGEAYHKLFYPTLIEKWPRGEASNTEFVLSRWISGSVINAIGTLVSLAALISFRRWTTSSDVRFVDSAAPTLITLPIQHFAPPVSQLLILIAFYQLLFVLVFAFGWNQPSRSAIAIVGAASTLVFALGLLARRWAYQRAVGDMRLEMDNSTDSPLNKLIGKLVFSRQSNEAARQLKVSLSLYEKRDWQSDDGGPIVNLRELYWSIGCATEPGIDNPFQPETEFSFALSIPAWLPRPWSQPTGKECMGIDWELQVGGRFAGKKIVFTLPLDSIPAMLKQPIEKRIKISKLELKELLDAQSIRWQYSSEPGSSSIARKLRPISQFLLLFLIASLVLVGSGILVSLGFQEFFLWSLFASAAMLIAIIGERFIQKSIQIQDGNVVREWRVFGLPFRSVFLKDQLLQVCIEATGTRDENSDLQHVEYDIRVRNRRSPERGLRIARIMYRLTAKAFAKSIASVLDLPVAYVEVGLRSHRSINGNPNG